MLAPLNEYYTDEEYEFALRQMYRMMERNRIYTMATVILKEKNEKYFFTDQKIDSVTGIHKIFKSLVFRL